MTESNNNGSTWCAGKTWIKDVLSKSGIELMDVTTTKKVLNTTGKRAVKKVVKKTNNGSTAAKDTIQKMVYYQSTPLLIKTEKPTQAHYCTPLQITSTITSETTESAASLIHMSTEHKFHEGSSNIYSNCNNVAKMRQQQQLSNKSIIPTNAIQIPVQNLSTNPSNSNLNTNIKTEANIDLNVETYGASSPATSTLLSSTASITNNSSTAETIYKTSINRKSNANKPNFKCEQCGMTFGSKSAHTSHTKSHTKNIDLSAGVGAITTRLTEISDAIVSTGIPKTPNMGAIAGGDPYQCNVCQKTFAVPARLIRHYRTHTGERPFECEFCHKLFSVKENLQVHRRIHTKERPYKCDVCERAFEHSGKLHRHMRIHTGERPHKCSVCEKTFIQSGQLVIHMRTHTGEKPYKCPVEGCGKGFTCSKQLKVHSRTHTGEKPYHCDICFRDFGYNHVLKLHRVQHYGSKCYKCTICDETFKSKKEMEAHIKGHAKDLPDDEDDTINATVTTKSNTGLFSNSTSNISSGEATSMPGSPLSPISSGNTSAITRKSKEVRSNASSSLVNPESPSSPRSTVSSSSSVASASRHSEDSREFLSISPQAPQTLEVDHHSRNSGVVSTSNNRQLSSSLCTSNSVDNKNAQSFTTYIIDELPTDLSKQQFQQPTTTKLYHKNQIKDLINYNQQTLTTNYSYQQMQHEQVELDQSLTEPPTINPALLEAASIVRRRDILDSPCEEEDQQTELRLKQSQQKELFQNHKCHIYQSQQQSISPSYDIDAQLPTTSYASKQRLSSLSHDLSQYDDTQEANELIEHYKRGELARHGLHKGYAPVPKFEPSLLNNEIVRQVEAAIAPLRSSTESPERSSSPESDSMMMADRDIMTLPLRKRKLYMHEGSSIEASSVNIPKREMDKTISHLNPASNNRNSNATLAVTNANDETGSKVMRMSSVIQFAKAS